MTTYSTEKGSGQDLLAIAACSLFLAVTLSIVIFAGGTVSVVLEAIFFIPQSMCAKWLLERFDFSKLSIEHTGFSFLRIVQGTFVALLLLMGFMAIVGTNPLELLFYILNMPFTK